jgi:Na+/melibiose symporter-like transporter
MDVVTARPTELDRYAALARTTGIIGIAFLVLLFGPIIALASADEPALEATAAEAVKYFGNLEATWAQLTMAASTLGMIGSLWFFVAFGFLLRRYPTDRAARPVEQRRTLRSAALALDRPGVHEADVCAGSRSVSVANGETDSCSAS